MKIAMASPFMVILDPEGKGICWVETDSEQDAWEFFWNFNDEHGVVDLTEYLADDNERWEVIEDYMAEKGFRCVGAVLCLEDDATKEENDEKHC